MAYIDANGNLVAAPPAKTPSVPSTAGAGRPTDVESGAMRQPFRSLADLPQPTASTEGSQGGFSDRVRALVPRFSIRSPLGVLVILQIIMYFVSCWFVAPRTVITPDPLAMWRLGSGNYQSERCATLMGGKYIFELRRLVVPIFLHVHVMHILMNVLFQVFTAPKAQEIYGYKRFLCLFMVSGICGNLLSGAFEHMGVGSSTACYGVTGAYAVQAFVMWQQVEDPAWKKYMRNMILVTVGMCVLWEVIQWNTLDHFGHAGGLLSGICLGIMLARHNDTTGFEATKRQRLISGFILAVGMLACTLKIFVFSSQGQSPASCEAMWNQYFNY